MTTLTGNRASEQNLVDRLNRAESWLGAARKLEGGNKLEEIDIQTVFIYRYIAFNSLYGRWKYEGSERTTWLQLDRYFDNLLTLSALELGLSQSLVALSILNQPV